MDSDPMDVKVNVTFDRHEEFLTIQREILTLVKNDKGESWERESYLKQTMSLILSYYLEQAYLLDPYLESLLAPVVSQLGTAINNARLDPSSEGNFKEANRLAAVLYLYLKFRGHKTIVRFFPHEISDLSLVLDYLYLSTGRTQFYWTWGLRYVLLLWMSLICMLPFDFEQFDEHDHRGETANKIESVAKAHLGNAGLEREGAALLLARFYTRKDMVSRFPDFLQWSREQVQPECGPFIILGCLRVLCELTKSGPAEIVQAHLAGLMSYVQLVTEHKGSMANSTIRKLRAKLVSRVILRLLPVTASRARQRAKVLSPNFSSEDPQREEIDIDVPEETEATLESLFQALQDKDTIVRYSAAKGIARVAERLPSEFCDQILDNVLQLYTIHSAGEARTHELPAIAEATWHGASLACAELARRGLVSDDKLGTVIEWLGRALYFDIRQGAHSVGSSVRDAASYVIWSLARAQRPAALAPYMIGLSQKLIVVALYDREVHIRRAASAAFQECVGRTNLCPHGIPVLGKSDFYSVGLRRNAFLAAAPDVAQYEEYRPALVDHVVSETLRHWDPGMRQLGAQSLQAICRLDVLTLVPQIASRVSQYLALPDPEDVHGGILALTELAIICGQHPETEHVRREIFSYISVIPNGAVFSPRHELVTAAACHLVSATISLQEVQNQKKGRAPPWRKVMEYGLQSRSPTVQEAAAQTMASLSRLVQEAKQTAAQQGLCRVLGLLDYNSHPHGILQVLKYLLGSVRRQSPTMLQNVEARRNAYVSLPQILENVGPRLSEHLSPAAVCEVIDALLLGLEDYTMDERGDVGSWIRLACIKGLTDISEILLGRGHELPNLADYIPPEKFHNAIGGILKQGVERLDNVRQQAGQLLLRLLQFPLPDVQDKERWAIENGSLMKQLFLSDEESVGWHDGSWLFPKAVRLLNIERYRQSLLAGLVLSVSTKTDSTQRPVSTSLVDYAKSLPVDGDGKNRYSLGDLAKDLVERCDENISSNSIVIPILQTLSVLLERDAFEPLHDNPSGYQSLQSILSVVTRNISKIKNVQRILVCMRILVNMLPMPKLRAQCVAQLSKFLAHQFPKMRVDTAEYLYLILQTKDLGYDTEEAEKVLLETEWSSSDMTLVKDAAQRCAEVLAQDE